MSEYFLWFFVMVVTSANSQSANITCKFTTTGDLCCPDLEQQEELALGVEARIILLCLINNTQHFGARNDSNQTDGAVADVKCLAGVLQLDQTEVGTPESEAKLRGRLQSNELEESFFQTYESSKKCSCVVCFVADIRDILTFRCNNTNCDDKHRHNESDAQGICENVCEKSKYDRYIKSCAYATERLGHSCFRILPSVNNCDIRLNEHTRLFPFIPTALKSKGEDGYFGIPFRQVGGTSGFVILCSIYVTGLVLNCILIRIFIRHEEMRKDSKLIIINIAVADMLNLVLHSPPIDTFLVNSVHSPLSVTYVFYMVVGLSIYSVMMFSCHIYLTVLPVRNRRNSGYSGLKPYSPHAHALTAALLACLVPVPLISVIEEYYTVSLYVLVAYCAVPLCCSTLFSVGTSLQLGSCVQSVHCGSSDHEALRGSRSNSANTLVALIVVSAISYVPYFALPFIPPYIGEDSDEHPFLISWVFVWLNSFMNPIALYVANRNFRYYFNKYICFCCCGGTE
jgi:hypothetical protein